MRRRLPMLAMVAGLMVVSLSSPAGADHYQIDLSGPSEVIVGEELEIIATLRNASDGSPVEGATVVFYANSFFAGVTGEIRLGAARTDSVGVATFRLAFSVRGVHQVRVEVDGDPVTVPASVTISVDIGPQIVASEAGVEIPGFGSWVVTFVIGAVWAVMILAALWMVRVSRRSPDESDSPDGEAAGAEGHGEGRSRRRFNLGPTVAGVMIALAVGLVALLIRSPNTHHNFDPEGYNRSPVAYLDAAYLYPGPGLAGGDALTGDAVADGRALFLKEGCAGCHGLDAQGTAAARSPAFATRPWLETVVRTGLPGGMPAYAESDLTPEELDAVHAFLLNARDLLADEVPDDGGSAPPPTTTTTVAGEGGTATFAAVQQILQLDCSGCHGVAGGWSAADYESVVNSGDSGPAVVPGNSNASLLAQKLLGTQPTGSMMPPGGGLSEADIRIIVEWIDGGAAP